MSVDATPAWILTPRKNVIPKDSITALARGATTSILMHNPIREGHQISSAIMTDIWELMQVCMDDRLVKIEDGSAVWRLKTFVCAKHWEGVGFKDDPDFIASEIHAVYEAEQVEGSEPGLVAIIKIRVEQVTLVAKEEKARQRLIFLSQDTIEPLGSRAARNPGTVCIGLDVQPCYRTRMYQLGELDRTRVQRNAKVDHYTAELPRRVNSVY